MYPRDVGDEMNEWIYCRSGNIREVLISRISRGGQIREFNNHAKLLL